MYEFDVYGNRIILIDNNYDLELFLFKFTKFDQRTLYIATEGIEIILN